MSGPKITAYSLTSQTERILTEQMRCEQESLVCAAQIREMMRDLLALSEKFDRQEANVRLLMKRTEEGADQIETLRVLQAEMQKETLLLQEELNGQMPLVAVKYTITEAALAEKRTELKRLQALKARTEKLKDKWDAYFLQKEDALNIQRIQESIMDDLSGSDTFYFEKSESAPDVDLEDKKGVLHKKLVELLAVDDLPLDILSEVKQAVISLERISEAQHFATFDSITVRGLVKKIDVFRNEQEQKAADFKHLLTRYEALCAMAVREPRKFACSEKAADTLNAEIRTLELALVRQQEQAYISECVDEVMADMGYELIGSREVRKRSGKRFRNELFTFHEGTAVNVTYSPEGQISMELGGIAREDRLPTDAETEVLTQDMESFCSEFVEFERRLRAKGILVGERIALSPPAPEYAAIINVNDYRLSESVHISTLNTTKGRRKATEEKVMRRDE